MVEHAEGHSDQDEEDSDTGDVLSSAELSWIEALALPQVRGARAHIAKLGPTFSKQDFEKSLADEIAPRDKLWHQANPTFKPHRTDSDGHVTFDDQDTIEHHEEHARRQALYLRLELEPGAVDVDTFFLTGTLDRKVYSSKPKSEDTNFTTVLSKSQKRKLRKQQKLSSMSEDIAPSGISEEILKGQKPTIDEDSAMLRASSSSECQPRPRRYIVDSGASFHLVDPRTLTKKERTTIEDIEEPIPIETANGEVTVTQRCRVRVIELNLEVWAFLHEDTVCVLSLGLLVDRDGFTYTWKPGKAPELRKGTFVVSCAPHYNVPFIYASSARGLPFACTGSNSESPLIDDVIKEEMKGLEDLIPPPP